MSDLKYFVNLITGALHSCPKGSSFDKDRTKSSDYKGFNSDKERREYIQRQLKNNR